MNKPLLNEKNLRQLIIGILMCDGDVFNIQLNAEKAKQAIKIAGEIMASLERTNSLHPGVKNLSKMDAFDYWRKRCTAAENFIKESPCDPDITQDQIKAHTVWISIKNQNPFANEEV